MKIENSAKRNSRQRGFTVVEMLIAVAILTAVVAVALNGLNQVQRRNANEATKLDMTQQAREAMDQIVRDLHQAGYPNVKLFSPAEAAAAPQNIAAGITSFSNDCVTGIAAATSCIVFEGFVEGSGVNVTSYQAIPKSAANPQCPCLQRSQVQKAANPALQGTSFSTTADNMTGLTIVAFDISGNNTVDPTAVKSLTITLSVKGQTGDIQTHQVPAATFVSTVRYTN
jgi:prepilin-type N-terminal cleavage/methylation domain-containing protein